MEPQLEHFKSERTYKENKQSFLKQNHTNVRESDFIHFFFFTVFFRLFCFNRNDTSRLEGFVLGPAEPQDQGPAAGTRPSTLTVLPATTCRGLL